MTIGAYGFEPAQFFEALSDSGVDMFLDVRQRRGMRGSRYAFANASALQAELTARRVAYRHLKELAPGTETRDLQRVADSGAGRGKQTRVALEPAFVDAWERRNAAPFDWQNLVAELQPYRVPAVFCVERTPDACHRSLAATRLAAAAGVEVRHVVP